MTHRDHRNQVDVEAQADFELPGGQIPGHVAEAATVGGAVAGEIAAGVTITGPAGAVFSALDSSETARSPDRST